MTRSSTRSIQTLVTLAPVAVALAAVATLILVLGPRMGLPLDPHAPDWGLLLDQAPILQIHIAAAVTALTIGVVLLVGAKGNRAHRTLGWTWAAAMAIVAISSLFIREINDGAFSWIHLLTGWTIVILPMGLYAARRHEVARHRSRMVGLFVGGLIVAGLFTFFPGRLMWRIFLG